MSYHFVGPDGPLPAMMEEAADHDPTLWRLLDLVDLFDLSDFEGVYRADGSGGQPYDPRLMVVSVLWCYQRGIRSPAAIGRACAAEITLRVLWGGVRTPSRSTVERFIQYHPHGWAKAQSEMLRLCDKTGLVDVSTTATDSTPLSAPAALSANRSRARIRLAISEGEQALEQVIEQMQQLGLHARGGASTEFIDHGCGELLYQEHRLRRRLGKLRAAEAIAEQREHARPNRSPPLKHLAARIAKHHHDLQTMTAEQQQACDRYHAKVAADNKPPGPAPRPPEQHTRIRDKRALLDNAVATLAALTPAPAPAARANLTAASSRILKGKNTTTWVQGDLLTLTVGLGQIILAAQLPDAGNDHNTLHPHLAAVAHACEQADITTPMRHHLADAGFGSEAVFTTPTPTGGTLYIAVTNEHTQTGTNPPTTAATPGRDQMAERLATPEGAALYRGRSTMIEPVFAHLFRTDRHLHTRGPAKHTEITAIVTAYNASKYLRYAIPPPSPTWVLANDLHTLTN